MTYRIIKVIITVLILCIVSPALIIAADKPWPQSLEDHINKIAEEIQKVDMETLKKQYDKKDFYLIIDVREAGEYKKGHIPDAKNIPRGILEFEIWRAAGYPDKLDMNKKIYIHCQTGFRAVLAAKSLKDLGFKNVIAVMMDFDRWKKAGYPVALQKELSTDLPKAKYVGAKKCKTCHIKQYNSWEKTNMAESFKNLEKGVMVEEKKKAGLEDKDYTHDPECLKCHTTGYGKGGFVSLEETQHLKNVQCESCHGPGSEFMKIMKKKKKTFTLEEVKAAGLIIPSESEKGCLECHGGDSPFNEKVDPKYKFVFKERLEKTHKHFPLKYKH